MGINNLLQFLRPYSQEVCLKDYSGKTAAVDASCWLHKDLYLSFSRSGTRERTTELFTRYLRLFATSGVKPFLVFDGRKLPAKASENIRRQQEREEREKQAALSNDDAVTNRMLGEAASIKFEDVRKCIEVCIQNNVKYVVSPYESDAQLCYLVENGFADFVVTEDSDLIAYGCEKVLTKLGFDGKGELFILSSILQKLQISQDQFLDACIATGCDYLKNLWGVGVHRAFAFVKENLLEKLKLKGGNEEYMTKFAIARCVFEHQTVYNLEGNTCALHMWDHLPSQELQNLCGVLLSDGDAKEFAAGNIDFASGKKMNNFPYVQIHKPVPQKAVHSKNCNCHYKDIQSEDLDVQIISIDKDKVIEWTVPCFTVMKLKFVTANVKIQTRPQQNVLLPYDQDISGRVICTSHCLIRITGQEWLALWKMASLPDNNEDEAGQISDYETSSDDEYLYSVEDTTPHTLPFKVLGTCYSTVRQTALEYAFEYMYTYNRDVLVRLLPEPNNVHDPNAIAVYIMSTSDAYDKVGFIPKELTCYVHPCLQNPEFKCSVKAIRFRTSFALIGFYITLSLTKKGLWDKAVIRASRSVK